MPALKKVLAIAVAAVALFATGADAADRKEARSQVEFGIRVASQGLWREAIYRWQRAVELDPTYAAAWNNLAVALEQAGEFARAKQAYEKALQLDPKNVHIKQNFDMFKEINDRAGRQDSR